jgi:hypothetical protein
MIYIFCFCFCLDAYFPISSVARPSYRPCEDLCNCIEMKDFCEENCVNRAMYIECSSKCTNGDKCQNKRLTKHAYAKTKLLQTQDRGWGLQAEEDIKGKQTTKQKTIILK